jgi:large conductance mechanosensitive channel
MKRSIKKLKNVAADPRVGLKAARGFGHEFRAFISRGNVVDLAVGVVIGAAFGKIVSSLVNDIVMPLIGVLLGGLNFQNLAIDVGKAHLSYGVFIQNVIDFLIIAAAIFVFVKVINKSGVRTKTEVQDKAVKKSEDSQLKVLEEIRDELKKSRKR